MPPMDDSNPLGLRTQVSRQLPLPCQRQTWEETHWPALGCPAPPEPPAGAGGKEKSHTLASSAESRAQTEVPRPAKWSDEKGGPACHSACHPRMHLALVSHNLATHVLRTPLESLIHSFLLEYFPRA